MLNSGWTCCRAPERRSRRWASQRRAIDICSGNSAGLSNRRAKIGLRDSMAAHIAPSADAWTRSSTSRGEISSFSTQSWSSEKPSRAVPPSQTRAPRGACKGGAKGLQGLVTECVRLPASDREGVGDSPWRAPICSTRRDHAGGRAMANAHIVVGKQGDQRFVLAQGDARKASDAAIGRARTPRLAPEIVAWWGQGSCSSGSSSQDSSVSSRSYVSSSSPRR